MATASSLPFRCTVPPSYTSDVLLKLIDYNCGKVSSTLNSYTEAVRLGLYGSKAQGLDWQDRGERARQICAAATDAQVLGSPADLANAAYLAVNSWGSVIMNGKQCCYLKGPPFCVDTSWSSSTVAILVPFGVLTALFVFSVMASYLLPQPSKEPEQMIEKEGTTSTRRSAHSTPGASGSSRLRRELEGNWMQGSCLRVLPGAESFATAAANTFASLQQVFDFQEDNVRNQFEHLLSLWRSQVAMVADRAVGEGVQVDESTLLREALQELHSQLLEGFCLWRPKLQDYGPASMPEREDGELPSMGGAQCGLPSEKAAFGDVSQRPLREELEEIDLEADRDDLVEKERTARQRLGTQLAEIATYLLVWGEAGNIRFMPEVIYFITELVLAAEPQGQEDMYDISDLASWNRGAVFRSNLFLAKVIRPIYNMIFDEWYESVDVEPNQKDKKKLRPGLENFLPPDVANYDDWNEFFCTPSRLVEGLLVSDGTRLFDLPHERRFAALTRVDWQVSLEAAETKTHRELHSLWGVFATTHRVWLIHAVLFMCGVVSQAGDAAVTTDGQQPLMGTSELIRYAAVGLLVPAHALLWAIAQWQVTGRATRLQRCGAVCACLGFLKTLWWASPLASYCLLRSAAVGNQQVLAVLPEYGWLALHYALSCVGLFIRLFGGVGHCSRYNLFRQTPVPLHLRVVRYSFWTVVFTLKYLLGTLIFKAIFSALQDLRIALPGRESSQELHSVYYSTNWGAGFLLWLMIWSITFLLFISDTQLWFTIVCTFYGVGIVFVQRGCRFVSYALEDAVAKIPERFTRRVLVYSPMAANTKEKKAARFAPHFPAMWDRILEYMRYEDKIDNQLMGDLSFSTGESGRHVYWKQLQQPLGKRREAGTTKQTSSASRESATCTPTGSAQGSPVLGKLSRRRVKVPDIFRNKSPFEIGFKHYCCVPDPHWPQNPDVQWRLITLARGLGLKMPRPFRAPYMPGLTVLIPHYGESILMLKKELFQEDRSDIVPLMDWIHTKYGEEFSAFSARMQVKNGAAWEVAGSQWAEYTDAQWEKISAWAAMRLQTLWRTVAGMCLYHPALQCHFEAQGDRSSKLAKVWDPNDCFTCLVSMQMYKFLDAVQLQHTNRMFAKFPGCLKVAFIDCEDKGIAAELDGVHHRQRRRYFSCLIDSTCPDGPDGRKEPIYRVELPGYPILGDGKADNQNHAMPFLRGTFAQCIDANQGAYFEQMLLLPCALGEFRSKKPGDNGGKRIIGFPEHITSDIGSIGDFAASAEVAFGTILQRTYAVLGARMHYGHPDIMNKLYMMQQGGVSKGTKTINLSEDIFAGMDFTLRGGGRRIKHCEYFHLAKGRDLGFNTVLGFFSKLSSGTGEQVLSRQTFRLSQVLHLPEMLTFYYAHVGYYFTQFFVSWSMPMLVFVWLLVILQECEGLFTSFQQCDGSQKLAAQVMAETVGVWFSWLLLLFLVATSLPLVSEIWMERSLKTAMERFIKQLFTLSPLLFIFQAKVIGHYVMNELRYGGATYVSTGRGLPTERRPFVGEPQESGFKLKKVGGLYLDYATIAYYDGAVLLAGAILIVVCGGIRDAGDAAHKTIWFAISLGLTIVSWLYAPFIFNPYQFLAKHFWMDLRALFAFFLEDSGRHWVEWYDRTQLKPRQGLHQSLVDITFFVAFFFLAAWYATVNFKTEALNSIYTMQNLVGGQTTLTLLPPLGASMVYCILAVIVESLLGCSSLLRRRLQATPKVSKTKTVQLEAMAKIGTQVALETRPTEHGLSTAPKPPHIESVTSAHLQDDEVREEHSKTEEADEADEGEAQDEEQEPHATAQDKHVAPPPSPMRVARTTTSVDAKEVGVPCCRFGIPLIFSASVVLLLDLAEASCSLWRFWWIGWRKGFLAGLILKWALLSICIYLGEGILRSRWFAFSRRCGLPVQLWVRSHRMARDVLTSSLIFWALAPCVLLNILNEYFCPGCSAHQLLIYRDPGHLARNEADVIDILADGEDWGHEVDSPQHKGLSKETSGLYPGGELRKATLPAPVVQKML